MKYSATHVIVIAIVFGFFTFLCGGSAGRFYQGIYDAENNKEKLINAFLKGSPAPKDPNEGKWQEMRDYQIEVNEEFYRIYDDKRLVGELPMRWYSAFGKMIEKDNQ